MSTTDPTLTRPRRVVLAGVVAVLALVAAGVAGWGWGGADLPDDHVGAHVLALTIGQPAAIVLLLAAAFALPERWRTSDVGLPLIVGGLGLELAAGGVGYVVAAERQPGHPGAVTGLTGVAIGLVVVAAAVLVRVNRRRRDERREQVETTGTAAPGIVTDASTSGSVNNVPRWKYVVRFADAAGTTRWVTEHVTTYSPPAVGQAVTVYFDPSRPGDKRRIFVE